MLLIIFNPKLILKTRIPNASCLVIEGKYVHKTFKMMNYYSEAVVKTVHFYESE